MALNKAILKTQILAALVKSQNNPSKSSANDMAEDLATAIDTYVKSATVTTPIATTVTTAGSAVAQTGSGVQAAAIGTLS